MVEGLFGISFLTPLVFTILVSLFTSLLSQLSFKFFTNKDFLKVSRARMKELQKKLLKNKSSDSTEVSSEEYVKIQNELLNLNMEVMTHSLKPSLINTIPFLVIFSYINKLIPKDLVLLTLPVVNLDLKFFWVYFLFSIIFSTILRKFLNR